MPHLEHILTKFHKSNMKIEVFSLIPNLSCEGNDDDLDTSTTTRKNTDISQRSDGSETKWALGETFHRYKYRVHYHISTNEAISYKPSKKYVILI